MMCHLSHHPSITTMYNYYSTRHVMVSNKRVLWLLLLQIIAT